MRSGNWTRSRSPMKSDCPNCLGIGWVCENRSDELGCQCGAGMPCKCNRAKEPDVSQDRRVADATLNALARRGATDRCGRARRWAARRLPYCPAHNGSSK
jgi:hypothetical protein